MTDWMALALADLERRVQAIVDESPPRPAAGWTPEAVVRQLCSAQVTRTETLLLNWLRRQPAAWIRDTSQTSIDVNLVRWVREMLLRKPNKTSFVLLSLEDPVVAMTPAGAALHRCLVAGDKAQDFAITIPSDHPCFNPNPDPRLNHVEMIIACVLLDVHAAAGTPVANEMSIVNFIRHWFNGADDRARALLLSLI